MSEIRRVFQNLKSKNEAALIGYVTAGDPAPEYTMDIAEALVEGGVDILELGLPFSDPIADGPTIQAASVRALSAGTTPKMVLEIAGGIRRRVDVPVVIMTYYNPVFKMGLEKFFNLAKDYSVDGLIVPDLPVEEAGDYHDKGKACGVDTIFLASPSTSSERLRKIIDFSSGFVYLVSHFGITGEMEKVEDSTVQLVDHVLPYTRGKVPLAVGFGISKPEHIRQLVNAGADGVIVGSAFVNIVQKSNGNTGKIACDLTEFASQLKAATPRMQ